MGYFPECVTLLIFGFNCHLGGEEILQVSQFLLKGVAVHGLMELVKARRVDSLSSHSNVGFAD